MYINVTINIPITGTIWDNIIAYYSTDSGNTWNFINQTTLSEINTKPYAVILSNHASIFAIIEWTGSFFINNTTTITTWIYTTLTIDVPEGRYMRFSNDNNTRSDWEIYAEEKNWTLSDIQGINIVYAQFDLDNNTGTTEINLNNIINYQRETIETKEEEILIVSRSNGWGGWSSLMPDNCPNGDFSPSYYDNSCGTQIHESAPAITRPKDRLITRKEIAQFIDIITKNVILLEPIIASKDCIYSDIDKLTKEEQQSITQSCIYWLMWLHKNWKNVKTNFEPNTIVTYNETATILSRLLYDGKYNPSLLSPTKWYTPHVQQIEKIWLLTPDDHITQNLIIDILIQINKQPELIQRPNLNQKNISNDTVNK